MSFDRSVCMRAALAGALPALFSGCGGLSDAGEQAELSPTAVAHVVGYAGPDANGNVDIDVRAQSEVTLTGKESEDKDTPIVSFLWTPDEAANDIGAKLTVRNSTTVAVSVPRVSAVTVMEFTLTVEDADGDTDTATVKLTIHPVLDSDQFLQYVRDIAKLRIVAGTTDIAGGDFHLQLRARVEYWTRSGVQNTVEYDVGEPVAGTWLPRADATDGGPSDLRNPLFQFSVPSVDLDAITRTLPKPSCSNDPCPVISTSVADLARVDEATLELSIHLTQDLATPTANATLYALTKADVLVKPPASNVGTGAPVVLVLTAPEVNVLRITGGGLENQDTARSYYSAIDPGSDKLTLPDWLAENCFNPSAEDFGADAHAVYVNNFDLGFGRDMYFRTPLPDEGCASDISSVVINYATLEAAAKKIDPIIAVAMEYVDADADPSTPGLVTFYAFAPDPTGEFQRVSSVNFDGRGEKFLPGACTACHGGRPTQPDRNAPNSWGQIYNNTNGNVGATFMPFDLESFLYSDGTEDETDAAFPKDASNANLRAQLTRSQQEAEFKKLNLAVYSTYGSGSGTAFQCYDTPGPTGFAGLCELIRLWYGDDTSRAEFQDDVAQGWELEPDLYRQVYARNCRACHTQQLTTGLQFRTHTDFIQSSSTIIEQVFDIGGMPAARLTMDRLWQPGTVQGESAGQLLAQHLNLPLGTRPGDAVACFEGTPLNLGDETTPVTISRGEELTFSSERCNFASPISWQLARPGSSLAALTAKQSVRTAFTPDRAGTYALTLSIGPTGAMTSHTKYGIVMNQVPAAADLSRTVDLNVPMAIDVLAASIPGDLPSTVQINSVFGSGLSAVVDASQHIVVTASTVAGGTVNYSITDSDGGPENTDVGVITVDVAATITANDLPSESVNANTEGNQINLTASIAAQGQEVLVSIVSSPATSLVGTLGMRGTVSIAPCTGSPQNSCASYQPPVATISHFNGIAVGSSDTFEYQACFASQPATCASGTVTVQINGQFPFAPVANLLENKGCVSCHQNVQTGSTWTLASNATEKAAWCAVALPNQAGSEAGGLYSGDASRTMINPADPPESLLNLKPSAAVSHGVVPQGALLTTTELNAIRNWIGEGGAFTASSSQTCP